MSFRRDESALPPALRHVEQKPFEDGEVASGWISQYATRENALSRAWKYMSTTVARSSSDIYYSSMDNQMHPPQWMEHKNIAIDGTPLKLEESMSDPNFWERKYMKELRIAEEIEVRKAQVTFERRHDIIGAILKAGRYFGARNDGEKTNSQIRRNVLDEIELQIERDKALREEQMRNPTAAWDALVAAVESSRPMVKAVGEHRPRIDFIGVDPFLDSAASVIFSATKVGAVIGFVQGTLRAMYVLNADAVFLKASGIGAASLLNTTVFVGMVKWGGNAAIFSGAFCVGDRLVTAAKTWIYPNKLDVRQRSTENYVGGLTFAGSLAGVVPWYLLNDKRMASRIAASGAALGATCGMLIGWAIHRIIILNVSRLDASPRQLRRYEALIRRERMWVEKREAAVKETAKAWF